MAADGSGEAKDLTAGANYDVPPDVRGEESDINFSPDSKKICFTEVTHKIETTSNNRDLVIIAVRSGDETETIKTRTGPCGKTVGVPEEKDNSSQPPPTA